MVTTGAYSNLGEQESTSKVKRRIDGAGVNFRQNFRLPRAVVIHRARRAGVNGTGVAVGTIGRLACRMTSIGHECPQDSRPR